MARRQVGSARNCIEVLRHTKVKVTDPGTARSAILINADKQKIRRIKVDGCLSPAGAPAADWVVSKPATVDVIVELKGKNVDRAVDQIESTWGFWSKHPEYEAGQMIGAWILCSEYPRASTKAGRYRERLRAQGVVLLISTKNGEQRPFSDFTHKKL